MRKVVAGKNLSGQPDKPSMPRCNEDRMDTDQDKKGSRDKNIIPTRMRIMTSLRTKDDDSSAVQCCGVSASGATRGKADGVNYKEAQPPTDPTSWDGKHMF